MIELLVAMTILALGVLSLLNLLTASVQAGSKSANLTAASNLATGELERTVQSATKNIPDGSKDEFWGSDFPAPNTPFRTSDRKVAGTEFHIEVYAKTVADDSSGSNRMKRIVVDVSWWGGDKVEQGKLRTSVSRLVTEP